VIGAIEVSSFGTGVGADREAEFGGQRLDDGIETGALGAGYLDFFGRA